MKPSTKGIHPPPGTGPYGPPIQRKQVRRSWLVIAPTGDEQTTGDEQLRAACLPSTEGGAPDVVVLDLEDGVHESRKPGARSRIKPWLEQAASGGAEVFVRADLDFLYADLEAAVWHGITGVMLPKIESAAQVAEAEEIITLFEQRRGLPGVVELHLSLETLKGNFHAEELIGASRRVRSVSLGRIDIVAGLSAEPTTGELHRLPYLLQRLVVLARGSGVEPIGAWWKAGSRGTRATADETLAAAQRARCNGLTGGLCHRPEQVAALNQGFTPSTEDLARARRMLEAHARGTGGRWSAAFSDGHAVDDALAASAGALLRFEAACRQRDEEKHRSMRRAGAPL